MTDHDDQRPPGSHQPPERARCRLDPGTAIRIGVVSGLGDPGAHLGEKPRDVGDDAGAVRADHVLLFGHAAESATRGGLARARFTRLWWP